MNHDFPPFSLFWEADVGEAQYQRRLIAKLRDLFPGCEVVVNDPQRKQGILDLLILFKNVWAMLEVKASANSPRRPNQEYYVDQFNRMSFASFICPENEEQVLSDLQSAFGTRRKTRLSKS